MKSKSKDAFSNSKIKIPFFRPSINNFDKKSILKVLSSPLLTDGPMLLEFEKKFAKYSGAKYAIGVSNATAALHLSLKELKLKPEDEIIIPDMTFVATANSVLLAGATPVLADVDLIDYNISPSSIKKNITSKTKAILVVHFAGRACKMDEIIKIAKKNNLDIIEDCAHAIGAKINKKHVGNFGRSGCFSFYPTKNITTIEGGMVVTNSKKTAEYIRIFRNHGILKSLKERYSNGFPWDYDILEQGYNYRIDELRSSLGISQLSRLNKLNHLRQKASEYYNKKLSNIDGIITPSDTNYSNNVNHLYIIRITEKFPISRNKLFSKLLENGIRTSVHYKPLHEFPSIKKRSKINEKLENSKKLYREFLSLPLFPSITKQEQDYVISAIEKIIS